MSINNYKELIVWQRSIELVLAVYKLTEKLPKTETYGLSIQMRRCAVSIPSNIAEGRKRSTRKDFTRFLVIAYSSGSELETQVEIVKSLSFGSHLSFEVIDQLLNEIMRMLNSMLSKLRS